MFTSYVTDNGSSSVTRVGTCASMVANVSVNTGFGASHNLFTLPTWARPSVNQIATAKVNRSITHATLTPEGPRTATA